MRLLLVLRPDRQPDLGTALLVVAAGLPSSSLAACRGKYRLTDLCLPPADAWSHLHDYQRDRG
jgi:hypothetical protein